MFGALTVGLASTAVGGAQAASPTVAIDRTGTAAGEVLLITGGGWPAGATLIVELCGHGGIRGTVDCDVGHQRTAGVGASGMFAVELTSGMPPSPCPCVVKATDQATQIAATAPIAVAGMYTVPIAAGDERPERTIEISSMTISGGGTVAELFGAGGRRVLELTLVNTGALAVDSPDLSIAWGQGGDPDGFVAPPDTKSMEPGETQTLLVPLHRDALTFGRHTALVEVQGLGSPVVARATTTSHPWGLVALALMAVQVLLLRLRNRIRRRLARRSDLEPSARHRGKTRGVAQVAIGTGAPAPAPTPTTVIDLATVELGAPIERAPERPADTRPVSAANGSQAAAPVRAEGVEVARLEAEVAALRASAHDAVRLAVDLSQSLIAACVARVQEADAASLQQVQSAAARHAHAAKALDLAAERARAFLSAADAADVAVASTLQDATASRDALDAAAAALTVEGSQLADAARAELDRALVALDETLVGLSRPAASDEPSPAAPADHLDRRVAVAIRRALEVLPADMADD